MAQSKQFDKENTPWSTLLFDYTQATTLHGLRYTTIPDSGILRRLLWAMVLVTSFGLFTYLMVSKLRFLESHPKTINVEVSYNDSMVFPAVTICNSNKYRMSAIHKEGLYDLMVHAQDQSPGILSGVVCYETFALHLKVCGYPTVSSHGNSFPSATNYVDPLVLAIAETTRQVCKALCTQVYGLSCSSVIYDPNNRTCLLTSFTGNTAHQCSLGETGEAAEFFRRRRCAETAFLDCDHESDTADRCPLQNDEASQEEWQVVEASSGNMNADNTLASGRGHYRHLPLASNRRGFQASLYTGYMDTTGKCLAFFYSFLGEDQTSIITVSSIDEDKVAAQLLQTSYRAQYDGKWSRVAVRLLHGLHMVKIQGTRGMLQSSGMVLDDITLNDCDAIMEKSCMAKRSGNDYTGSISVSKTGQQCLGWHQLPQPTAMLALMFPYDVSRNGGSSCRTLVGDTAPSCFVEPFIMKYCSIDYCECDAEQFTCANHFCLPKSMTCDGNNDCWDGSDEWAPCALRRTFACDFNDNYICGYTFPNNNEFTWAITALEEVFEADGNDIPSSHPTGGTHYMLLNAFTGQGGDKATLHSPVINIEANKTLQFYLFVSQTKDIEVEQFQIFLTISGVRKTKLFTTNDHTLKSGRWNVFQAALPMGQCSLSMEGTLNSGTNKGSIALASVSMLDTSPHEVVMPTEKGNISCDFLEGSCGYNYMSNSTFFTFQRESVIELDEIPTGKGCGGIYRDQSGEITSPNFPERYDNHASCIYYIVQPEGSTIDINFTAIDVEANQGPSCYDYIKVQGGIYESSWDFTGTHYCGKTLPPPLSISNNTASIYFFSDYSVTRGGFSLTYNTTYGNNQLRFNSKCQSRLTQQSDLNKASMVSVAVDVQSVSCLALRVKSLATFVISSNSQSDDGRIHHRELLRSNIMLGFAWHIMMVQLPSDMGKVHFMYEASGSNEYSSLVTAIDQITFTPGSSCVDVYGNNGSLACDFSEENQCGYVDVSPSEFHWLRIQTESTLAYIRGQDDDDDNNYDDGSGSGIGGGYVSGDEESGSGTFTPELPSGSGSGEMPDDGSGQPDVFPTLNVPDYVMGVEVGTSGGIFILASPEVIVTQIHCLQASLFFLDSHSSPPSTIRISAYHEKRKSELAVYWFHDYGSQGNNPILNINLTDSVSRVEFQLEVGPNIAPKPLYVWLGEIQLLLGPCTDYDTQINTTFSPDDNETRSTDITTRMPTTDSPATNHDASPTASLDDHPSYDFGDPVNEYQYLLELSGGILMGDLSRTLGHRLEDMVMLCWWDGHLDKCDPIVSEITDSGQCLSFNSRVDQSLTTFRTGADYGLRLILNIEEYEYATMNGDIDVGIKVHLHTQEDSASVQDLGFAVSPGVHALTSVTFSETHSLLAPWGNCSKITLSEHNNRTDYTRQRCSLQCKAEATFAECQCIAAYMPGSERPCNLSDYLLCVNQQKEAILEAQGECESRCPDACDVVTFQTGVSYGNLQGSNMHLILNNNELERVQTKYAQTVDLRSRITDEHMIELLNKIRTTQKAYSAGILFLTTKVQVPSTSVFVRVLNAINALADMAKADHESLMEDVDKISGAYASSVGPSIDFIYTQLNLCNGLLGTMQSILFADAGYDLHRDDFESLKEKAIECLDEGIQAVEVFRTYLRVVGTPSDLVPLNLLSSNPTEYSLYDSAISEFIEEAFNLVNDLYATDSSWPVNVVRSHLDNKLEAFQLNIRKVTTGVKSYHKFLLEMDSFQKSLNYKQTDVAISDYKDVTNVYEEWQEWLEESMEQYATYNISKEQLCEAMVGYRMERAKESMVGAINMFKSVDMTQLQAAIRTQGSTSETQYTTALTYMAQLEALFASEKFSTKARTMKIWRRPTVNFNSETILSYKLRPSASWKSWSPATNFNEFILTTSSGSRTITSLIADYNSELNEELNHVAIVLSQKGDYIMQSINDVQTYCRAYNASINANEDFGVRNYLQLDIFYGELKYQYIEQLKGYDVMTFLGEIGGYMGLLLGGSIITVIEFLDLIIFNVLQKMSRQQKRNVHVSPMKDKNVMIANWSSGVNDLPDIHI